MRLSVSDKNFLSEIGYSEFDCKQIERASGKTCYEYENKRIGQKRAIELLGRENYLSGLARSAFHWSATRETPEGNFVSFDSSRFFRE